MAGKSTKTRADAAPDTMMSPRAPAYAAKPQAAIEARSSLELNKRALDKRELESPERTARSSERVIVDYSAQESAECLVRNDVLVYLGPACPKEHQARVDIHIAGCEACRQWVRHLDDDILEYIGGQRSEEELARMDAHLDACNTCRDLMHHVVQGMAQSRHGGENDPTDSSTTFSSGNVVHSRYRIRRFVGRGGMGEVYEAFDQLMDRRIALKTVLCTVADRPRAARRFKEEVRNAQRVGHPHVCRINDLQEHQEGVFGPPLPFFTMEFIDGDRLGNRLLAGPLALEEVRIIALQLLSGLDAAHERGVLHLDFKSDNVMLRRPSSGTPARGKEKPDAVIMDFGLSRVLGNESRLRTSDRRQFAGTLPYMSVEQLECREDLGPATDVYAFGVVLYEMLTRNMPFEGDTLGAVLLKQLNERAKPPSRFVPGLSPALDRFVLKCLSNKPHLRYANAGQALAALEAVGAWTRPQGPLRFLKTAVPLAAVAVIAGLIAAPGAQRNEPAGGAIEQATHALAPVAPARAEALRAAPPGPPAVDPGAAALPPAAAASPGAVPPVSVQPAGVEPAAAAPAASVPAVPPRAYKSASARAPSAAAPSPAALAPAEVAASAGLEPARTPVSGSESNAGQPGATAAREVPQEAESGETAPVDDATRAGEGSSWKPARVPKRLRAPAGDGSASP